MSDIPPLIRNNGFVLQQSNNSSDDELVSVSILRKILNQEIRVMMKKELEVMAIPIFHRMLLPKVENLFQGIVKEQIEWALAKFLATAQSDDGNELRTTEPRRLALRFRNKLSRPILTGKDITGEGCDYVEVALVDELSGKTVESGPEANADVEIVAREASEGEGETSVEFNSKNIGGSKAKKSLLAGDVVLTLNNGIGTLKNIRFRNSQQWMKQNLYFKLYARVINSFSGVHIQEAKSESFTVKDCRNRHTEKKDIPDLSDGVWRLKNIAKNKEIHKLLQKKGIETVEDFLRELFKDTDQLRQISGMKPKNWEITVKHARTCHVDKRMSCFADSEKKIVVVFNLVDQVLGVVSECQYIRFEDLSADDKTYAHKLVVDALGSGKHFENFDDIDSVLCYFSSSCASVNSSSSQGMEFPGGQNIDSPNMINPCYRNQFNTSDQEMNSDHDTPMEMDSVPQSIDDFNLIDNQHYTQNTTFFQEPEALPLEMRSDDEKADARGQELGPDNWNNLDFLNDEVFSSSCPPIDPTSSGAMEPTRDQNVEAPELFSECNNNWPCFSVEDISPPCNSAGGTFTEMHPSRDIINTLNEMDGESPMDICGVYKNPENVLQWDGDTSTFYSPASYVSLDHTSSARLELPESLASESFRSMGQFESANAFSQFNLPIVDSFSTTPCDTHPGSQTIDDSYMMDDQPPTEHASLSASSEQSQNTAAPDTEQHGLPKFKKWHSLINVLSLTKKFLRLSKSLVDLKKRRLRRWATF